MYFFFRVYNKDEAAVVDAKSQGRNERFELDMYRCAFRQMTTQAHTYHYVIE
jgi:hypothetical protein